MRTQVAADTVRAILRHSRPKLPTNERLDLELFVVDKTDEYEVHADFYKLRSDGMIYEPSWRHARVAIGPRELRHAMLRGGSEVVALVRSCVDYVVKLIRPDPLPVFRIRTRGSPKHLQRRP